MGLTRSNLTGNNSPRNAAAAQAGNVVMGVLDIRPKCSVPGCNSAYEKKHQLAQHVKHVHGAGGFKCPVSECDAAYNNFEQVYKHILDFHGCIFFCPVQSCQKFLNEHFSPAMRHINEHKKPGDICLGEIIFASKSIADNADVKQTIAVVQEAVETATEAVETATEAEEKARVEAEKARVEAEKAEEKARVARAELARAQAQAKIAHPSANEQFQQLLREAQAQAERNARNLFFPSSS